jgi:prepilin-type N-terminal cleavage/methylation domain-containing protein
MVRLRKGEGFTLIELMIVVAILGIVAAVAVPSYVEYVKRSKMSEVLAAFDAIAQGASEYHAVIGFFPDATNYTAEDLASFDERFADITIQNGTDPDFNIRVRAVFNANLDLTRAAAGSGQLDMLITYDATSGYTKSWDIVTSSIDSIFIPRGGH